MTDYEENKLSWWFLLLSMITLVLIVPLSLIVKELALPLCYLYIFLTCISLGLRLFK